jgi:type I restriction enzyme S subunit
MAQKLLDICKGKGRYGIAASAVPYSTELPTYLRITDINDDGTLNFAGLKSVDDPNAEKYALIPNDIVFARTGASTGRNYFYDGTDGDFVYAGFLIKFSLDPSKVNPMYMKYYCQSQIYCDWVRSFNAGSTRGNINAQTFGDMPVMLPSREQQDFTVETLAAIDDKIAVNAKINHHLASPRSTTDSSPDIRRGKRESRSSAR